MKFNRTTRRMFLTGAGGAVLAMPLLSSLLPRELRSVAQAGGPTPPRRFLALKTYNGMPVDEFWGVGGTAGHPTNPRDGTLAFSLLNRLVERYPASPYAPDAQQRMVYLKNRLAASRSPR